MAIERDGFYHAVSVDVLRALLLELQDDDVLVPNDVKNLMIIRDHTYIGFVDFGGEIVDISEDEDDG